MDYNVDSKKNYEFLRQLENKTAVFINNKLTENGHVYIDEVYEFVLEELGIDKKAYLNFG